MNSINISKNSMQKLKDAYLKLIQEKDLKEQIVKPKNEVISRYQPIFRKDNIQKISDVDFLSFLNFNNNHHWTGLQRSGSKICSKMNKLRKALSILIDEEKPITVRLNQADSMVYGMGRAIATAILLICYPDKYGVWNNKSENGMKAVGVWPQFERGLSFGERYKIINAILNTLAKKLNIDLWTLDAVWEIISLETSKDDIENLILSESEEDLENIQRFGLERHLHEFLRDNWHKTSLGKEWDIYSEPGDEEAGFEYPCGVGRIDILAKHKKRSEWLVVELKRDRSSDRSVGQVLRYIGWIRKNLAKEDEKVKGMIIINQADDNIKYAVSAIPNVDLQLYKVDFKLLPVTF